MTHNKAIAQRKLRRRAHKKLSEMFPALIPGVLRVVEPGEIGYPYRDWTLILYRVAIAGLMLTILVPLMLYLFINT
jgi:hypothetical protein